MSNGSPHLHAFGSLTLRYAPLAILILLILFVGTSIFGRRYGLSELWRGPILSCLLLVAALWFIACFTGDAECRLQDGFVFAYAFTLGAFALLITPFVGSDARELASEPDAAVTATKENGVPATSPDGIRPPVSRMTGAIPPVGVLQLFRGCIAVDENGAAEQVSAVARCPRATAGSTPRDASTAQPASASNVQQPAAPAASTAAPATSTARSGYVELTHQYTWLVSIGGVTARTYRWSDERTRVRGEDIHAEVLGGLVVPLYVVVLAFMGGAISLSRRIPEYQRRSDPAYVGTPQESAMLAFQARESVVFQIMQLTSAPFLAMATWYIVTPATLASAATLAFGTGFASEYLLLLIRGMVEGIRPQGAGTLPARFGSLRGVICRKTDMTAVANAKVTVEWADTKEKRDSTTNAQGEFDFGAVRVGKVKLTVEPPPPNGPTERLVIIDDKAPGPLKIVLD